MHQSPTRSGDVEYGDAKDCGALSIFQREFSKAKLKLQTTCIEKTAVPAPELHWADKQFSQSHLNLDKISCSKTFLNIIS